MEAIPATDSSLRVVFSESPVPLRDGVVRIAVPWLGGEPTEEIFTSVTAGGESPGLRFYRAGDLLMGHAQIPFSTARMVEDTQSLYSRVIEATRGRHLLRIWNYVPQINASTDGLENYRAFCKGRSLAFEVGLGAEFATKLPAASAVGCQGDQLAVIFVAGSTVPAHFENPAQVPAYEYPEEHGPRPPSFARATVAHENGKRWTFISGTAAIRGHETVAPGTLEAQLDCTLENLRLIGEVLGLGPKLEAWTNDERHFKVYLRHAADFGPARALLEQSLFRGGDKVVYLKSDICRAALNIEIEATLVTKI